MNIFLTEEEREFLERVCKRAEIFSEMGILPSPQSFADDRKKIKVLINKLRKDESSAT